MACSFFALIISYAMAKGQTRAATTGTLKGRDIFNLVGYGNLAACVFWVTSHYSIRQISGA